MVATAATVLDDIAWQDGLAATYEPPLEPSEALFEYLAAHDPERLFGMLERRELAAPHMTFAAEIAGRCARQYEAAVLLAGLLEDPSPLVREGAIYGLEHLLGVPGVEGVIRRHTEPGNEPSPGVRDAAIEALDLR